jgi:hypothetical protein
MPSISAPDLMLMVMMRVSESKAVFYRGLPAGRQAPRAVPMLYSYQGGAPFAQWPEVRARFVTSA